jgi:hypothetical protein
MPCLRPAEGAFPCRMPLVPRSPCADAAGMACTRRRVIRATPLRPGRTLRRMGDQALGHQRRRCPYRPADSWAGIRPAAGARWHGHDQQRAACVGALAEHRRGRGSSGDADTYELSSEYADVAAVAAALASGQGGPVDVAVHSIGTTCVLGAAAGGAPFRRIMLYEPPGSQAGLGPRSGRPGRGKAGPRPERRMARNAHPRRERRSWRVCPAAAARARNSLVRSAAMAWVITGCMTFSSLANRPSRALLLTLSLRGTTVPRRRTHRPARHGLEDGTRCLMHPSRPSACLAWRSLSRSYHSVRVWALSARPPLPAVAVCASACSRGGGTAPSVIRMAGPSQDR